MVMKEQVLKGSQVKVPNTTKELIGEDISKSVESSDLGINKNTRRSK